MDIIALDAFLASSFFFNFAGSYLADKTAQAAKKFIKRTFKKENLDDQLVDALNDSLKETCKQFNIQYQEGVTLNEFIASIANRGEITTKTLRKILEDVVEIQDSDRFMDAWIIEFEKAVAHPEREWLRNFLLMQNIIVDDRLKTDNARYADNFEEVMFLHTEAEHKVRLCDLYIPPNRVVDQDEEDQSQSNEIIAYIKSFIESNNFDALILEGDAGVGKTSFVSYLAHMYLKKTKEWAYYFGARELISIRLRDLIPDSGSFSKKSICNDVLKYLNVEMKSKNQFKDEHKDAVVILDGFDELCMIEGIKEHQGYYIKELCRLFDKCRFIITTRPHYLNVDELVKKDINCDFVMLDHFRSKQRKGWVNQYKEAVLVVDEEEIEVLDYILTIRDDDTMAICDTPMILYMMVRGRINEEARENIWALYHQIFYKEITETEYNKIFPSEYGDRHPIEEYSEEIYRLNAEIAYRMYQSNNRITYLSEKDVEEILDGMNFSDKDENVKQIVKSCYALCSYWKNTSDKGVVEFYHNSIRDFFMCEKIFFVLNKIYQEKNLNIQRVALACQYFFSGPTINNVALNFLYHRIVYEKNTSQKYNFIKGEFDAKFIENGLLSELGFNKECYNIDSYFSFSEISSMFENTVNIYRVAYEPYLSSVKKIYWTDIHIDKIVSLGIPESADYWKMERRFYKSKYNLIPYFLGSVFNQDLVLEQGTVIHMPSKGVFYDICADNVSYLNADFSNIVFQNCRFTGCSFEYANLENATFEECIFQDCSFRKANLVGCRISDTQFFNIILDDVKLPDGFTSNKIEKICEHIDQLGFRIIKSSEGKYSSLARIN